MRARHVIAVAFILVLVGVKLTFFAAPIAEADARSIESGSVDVFQIHQSRQETSGAEQSTTCRSSFRHQRRDRSRTHFRNGSSDIPERNAKAERMIADINRWVLLAALAGARLQWGRSQAHAQSLDRMEESAGYALTDALMPYAQRDYGRALALLAPLAEQGNAVAQLKLGMIFSRGKTGSPDHVAALRWFTKAAEQGQVEAQFELGRIYRDGLGTRVDGNAAVSWLERAAEKDTPHALNALGELYLGHQNVPQDFAVARSWFLRGAQAGNSRVHVQPGRYLCARTRRGAG